MSPKSRTEIINVLGQIEDYIGIDAMLHNFIYKYLSIDELDQIMRWSMIDLDLELKNGVIKQITELED